MDISLCEIIEKNATAVIASWHVSPGQIVKKGDDLLEVVTDKAVFEVASPCDGRISDIFKCEGDEVLESDSIASIVEVDYRS